MEQTRHISECQRCGKCCEKGGPAFHSTDKTLIDNGTIHTRYLYTIRRGEKVRDNVLGVLITADSELIKIKGKDDSWACCFYDAENRSCGIYEHRPLECRVLKCWNTREILALYNRDRLERKDLLQDIAGLWPLLMDHEQRCSYSKLARAVRDLEGSFQKSAVAAVMRMVRYDMEIRSLVAEKGNMQDGMTDFLFGRPLTRTIGMYGYKVKVIKGKYTLMRT